MPLQPPTPKSYTGEDMIKRVRIITNMENAVWSDGYAYPASGKRLLADNQTLYDKNFDRGTSMDNIWRDLRENVMVHFFSIFFPSVIEQTAPPVRPFTSPDQALMAQTRHIRERQASLPEYYMWDEREGKWHMSLDGYMAATGDINIGFAEEMAGIMYRDEAATAEMDVFQEQYKGSTQMFVLFVYPDRYDELIRATFVLEVTFWE
jgi:hypothetical protein